MAVTGFRVGQALVFFRERAQGLGEQHILIHGHVQVALARLGQGASHSHDVPQIPVLGVFLDILGRVDLDPASHVLDHLECLAIEHHAAGNGHLDTEGLQLFLGFFTVFRLQFGGGGVTTKVVREGVALVAHF